MKKITLVTAWLVIAMLIQKETYAQGLLKKLKDKANQVANDAMGKKVDDAAGVSPANTSTGGSSSSGSSGHPTNNTGEGLKNTTPPDVSQQITDAQTAQAAGNFSDARYSIQQALLGVELQLGKAILKSLPATVSGLPKDTTEDRVTSTQWGWANLTIQSVYRKDDKQFTVMIGNNSVYGPMMNIYFSGNYTQSNGQTQDFKQIKVSGNRAVIKFDKSEGYTVLVQLGQSGLVTYQGVNFANEQDMMTAVNAIDINGIKTMLGEK